MPEQYPIAPIDTQEDYPLPPPPAYPVWTPRKKFQNRRWLHVTLFVLTFLSTTAAGAGHYLGFVSDFGPQIVRMTGPALFVHGLWYSGTILLILGAHEMGHYLACRYYQVDASLPCRTHRGSACTDPRTPSAPRSPAPSAAARPSSESRCAAGRRSSGSRAWWSQGRQPLPAGP